MSNRINEEVVLKDLKATESHISVIDSSGEEHTGAIEWSDIYNIAMRIKGCVRVFNKSNIRYFEYAL